MKLSDLDYLYPEELVALTPGRPSRVAFVEGLKPPQELDIPSLLDQFSPGDLLVVNETEVTPARIFSRNETEILFLRALNRRDWQVLFPAREYKIGAVLELPGDVSLTLKEKGLPQVVEASQELSPQYFREYGEFALPPYIQQGRGERRNLTKDREWYQSAWAKVPGSVAAPTASLHFNEDHLKELRLKGVGVEKLTLHVGAGTFLPVRSENLDEHEMHSEPVTIPSQTLAQIRSTQAKGARVWALGTTVARSLEAWAAGDLQQNVDGSVSGETQIFIRPPFEFKVVNGLLTNFHQPRSTLLSLVAAFAGLDKAKATYAWAIEKRFRLFSYGDLSAWTR